MSRYDFIQLYFPLIMSNVFHMIIVKRNYLQAFKHPLSIRLFGENKTYRGFVVLIFLTAIFQALLHIVVIKDTQILNMLLLGALLGFTYSLFELPNSYLKRFIGIKAGEKARSYPLLFLLLDKLDSTLGVSIVYSIIFKLSIIDFCILFFGAFLLHSSLSYLLVLLKVKESL